MVVCYDVAMQGKSLTPHTGFKGYTIYPDGKIWSSKSRRYLNQSKQSNGYMKVSLNEHGKRLTISMHRLLAMVYIPNPDNLPHINHINGVKTDNRLENLEWCTPKQNMQHAINSGLYSASHLIKYRNAGLRSDAMKQWYKRGSNPNRKRKYCSLDGCGNYHNAKGLCKLHYMRHKRER